MWNSSPSSDAYKLFLQLTFTRGADEVYNMEQIYGHTQSHQTKEKTPQCYEGDIDNECGHDL